MEVATTPKCAISLLPAESVSSLTSGLKVRSETQFDELVLTVEKSDYRTLCERLFAAGFDFPSSMTGVDMEWGLVDTRGAMKRPHGRKSASSSRPSLKGLDAAKVSPWLKSDGPQFNTLQDKQAHNTPVQIDMAKLYAQLDFLAGIAANPIAKAKRLAFHLARTQQGIIMAPEGPTRIAGRWGTQVRASFDAMAASIITQSRNRPPPLKPLRTHWPTITAF